MTPENEIIDTIFDTLPSDVLKDVDYTPYRPTWPHSEMYFILNDKCYQVTVKEHPHG